MKRIISLAILLLLSLPSFAKETGVLRISDTRIIHFSDELHQVLDESTKFRRIVRALIKSGQCDPKKSDRKSELASAFYYACVFEYKDKEVIIFSKSNYKDALVSLASQPLPVYMAYEVTEELQAEIEGIVEFREEAKMRRHYPQFRNSRPKSWMRLHMYDAVSAEENFHRLVAKLLPADLILETNRLLAKYE